MKKLYVFLALIASLALSAQIKLPENIKSAAKSAAANFQEKEVWLEWPSTYTIKFEQNPVGIEHLFEELDRLLMLNEKSFEHPSFDNNYLANYLHDIKDYQKLDTALKGGDSEIDMLWSTGKDSYISITLNTERYEITITKI